MVEAFSNCVDRILKSDISEMGEKGYRYLCDNYLVDNTYRAIVRHLNGYEERNRK